jgi:hypothetical protein
VEIEGLLCVCFALARGGVLVVARETTAQHGGTQALQRDLESIGAWLCRVIDANLASAPGGSAESHLAASLHRLLREAVARGSARGVVSAFVETLGVWLDIDVRGYVADAQGRFFRAVSPLGADPSVMSAELESAGLRADSALVRLSGSERERLGCASTVRDVLIRRIFTHSGASWLLVFDGAIGADDESALTVYSDLLCESLNDLIDETNDRVAAAILPHLSRADRSIETIAKDALDEIVAAVGARVGALTFTSADGTKSLAIGHGELSDAGDAAVPYDRLVVRSSHDGDVMVASVAEGRTRFTEHDRAVVEAGIALLHPWARAALEQPPPVERRESHESFQSWIERRASEAILEGAPTSLIVLSIPDEASRSGFMQAQVGRIRNELRPSDFAGSLTGHEIAVLLPDTAADQAAFVSDRLKKLLEGAGDDGGVIPAVGLASCSPERPVDGSIVNAARENAATSSRIDPRV